MKDQVDQLQANGAAAACLNSTQTREQQLEVMTGCRTGQIRLLYIARERLMLIIPLSIWRTGIRCY